MTRAGWAALALAMTLAGTARAAPCDVADASARTAAIDAHLARERHRAHTWNLAWGLGFGAAGALQLGATFIDFAPGRTYDRHVEIGLYVGASKAAIASVANFVLPLRIEPRGAATSDPCADLAGAEGALRDAARAEQTAFYVNHVGNLLLNVGGLLYQGLVDHDWGEGAMGVVLGYPIGVINTYTQPRASWHALRGGELLSPPPPAITVNLGLVRHRDYTGLALAGSF